MDRSSTAHRDWRAFRPSAQPSHRSAGVRDHAIGSDRHRDCHADRSDRLALQKNALRHQHATLAHMVGAVEPDIADELASRLLAKFGSLTAILSEPADELTLATGNPVLGGVLSAARDVVVAALLADLPKVPFSPANPDVIRYITAIMGSLTHEEGHVFFLDGRRRFLQHEVFSYGSDRSTTFPVQIIFRRAIQIGSDQLVLIHNHPSGLAEPSAIDQAVTRTIASAGRAIGTCVHDHLVVAGARIFSFRAAGLL